MCQMVAARWGRERRNRENGVNPGFERVSNAVRPTRMSMSLFGSCQTRDIDLSGGYLFQDIDLSTASVEMQPLSCTRACRVNTSSQEERQGSKHMPSSCTSSEVHRQAVPLQTTLVFITSFGTRAAVNSPSNLPGALSCGSSQMLGILHPSTCRVAS
jgi:hypothetical protein